MKDERVSGRVLLKRETGLIEGLGRDNRNARVLLLFASVVVMGGGITAIISDLSDTLPLRDENVRLCIQLFIIGLGVAFFVVAAVAAFKDRPATVITDTGILYAGIFQRWAEIRCCVMRKTRRGLIVWTRSRRRLRMYFHDRDAETIEALFRCFCSAEAFVPDNCKGSH